MNTVIGPKSPQTLNVLTAFSTNTEPLRICETQSDSGLPSKQSKSRSLGLTGGNKQSQVHSENHLQKWTNKNSSSDSVLLQYFDRRVLPSGFTARFLPLGSSVMMGVGTFTRRPSPGASASGLRRLFSGLWRNSGCFHACSDLSNSLVSMTLKLFCFGFQGSFLFHLSPLIDTVIGEETSSKHNMQAPTQSCGHQIDSNTTFPEDKLLTKCAIMCTPYTLQHPATNS